MTTTYINLDGTIYQVDTGTTFTAKICIGQEKQVASRETDTETIYYHGVFDLSAGLYSKDPDNTEPIEVDGQLYELDAEGEVHITKPEPISSDEFIRGLIGGYYGQ